MTALYIILGVLAFIFLLLMIPVVLRFDYSAETSLVLKYLFFKFTLFPRAEKPVKEEKKTDKPQPQVSKIKELKDKHGLRGLLDIFKEIAKLAGAAALKILKRVKIRELDIYAVAGGDNAAETALLYGEACAVIYPVVNMLKGICRCKKTGVMVDADYKAKESAAICQAVISIRPVYIAGYGLKFIFKLIPRLMKLR